MHHSLARIPGAEIPQKLVILITIIITIIIIVVGGWKWERGVEHASTRNHQARRSELPSLAAAYYLCASLGATHQQPASERSIRPPYSTH